MRLSDDIHDFITEIVAVYIATIRRGLLFCHYDGPKFEKSFRY